MEKVDAENNDAEYWLSEELDCEKIHQDTTSFYPNDIINKIYLRFKEEFSDSTGLN